MKNYFEVFKGNEGALMALGEDEKEYHKILNKYDVAVDWLKRQPLQEMTNKYLESLIERAEKLKQEAVEKDNLERSSGVSFQERQDNIARIEIANQVIDDFRGKLKTKIQPIEKWVESADVRNIKEYGLDWFIKTFFKKFYGQTN